MSIVAYLGCNFPLAYSEEGSVARILVGDFCTNTSDREHVKNQFTTKYIYEIYPSNGGIQLAEVNKLHSPDNYKKDQDDFLAVCELVKPHLQEGDYCELYTCWVGEEDAKEHKQSIRIDSFHIEGVVFDDKTLLTIKK